MPSFRKRHTPISKQWNRGAMLLVLVLAGVLGSGCKEQITGLGSQYYTDKIAVDTSRIYDTSILKISNYTQRGVYAYGTDYAVNSQSTIMFIGKVNDPLSGENIQSWGLFHFTPTYGQDTINELDSIYLILRFIPYNYGPDTANGLVDFSVYYTSQDSNQIQPLTMSTLQGPVGRFTGPMNADSSPVVTIKLDPSVFPLTAGSSNSFVVVPTGAMNTIRAVGTSLNTTGGFAPVLQYFLHTSTGTFSNGLDTMSEFHAAEYDYHVVQDSSTIPAGAFSIRGSVSQRVFIDAIMTALNKTKDSIGTFSTINSAQLVLHLATNGTSQLYHHSSDVTDTAGPAILEFTSQIQNDSTPAGVGNGSHDANDPTTYRFQMRTLLEQWLRDSTKNFGATLSAVSATRTFANHNYVVDDYSMNWWVFYGFNAPDPSKRPSLQITYSTLK